FNPYANPLDFSWGGFYEPLTFYVPSGKRYYYLASGMKVTNKGKTINLTLRQNVKWNDGKPFTSADAVYTLEAGKTINPAFDRIGLTNKPSNVKSVKAVGTYGVQINLVKADSTFVGVFNNLVVLPKHIWTKVTDPTKWTDPNPVGTGPFKLSRFNSQEYILTKRADYYLPMHITCLERLYESGNDSAMLSMLSGTADWTHNFVPQVQNVYSKRDPAHFHYWYSTLSGPIGFFMDITKYPYSLKPLREAISMAINRQNVYKNGEYGYAPPAGALGIEHQYPKWIDPKLKKQDLAMAPTNAGSGAWEKSVKAARTLLKKAGFTWNSSGALIDPKGAAVTIEPHVISGWTDWVASLKIMQENLQTGLGLPVNLTLDPDWGTWWPLASTQSKSTLLWTYSGGPTPYEFFNEFFNPKNVTPSGSDESGSGDWPHFSDATGQALLLKWTKTTSKKGQMAIAYKLEARMLKDFPLIPVFVGPVWFTYSTKYFTGWPDAKHPYANGEWGAGTPDWIPLLTHLTPAKK
ncbi:MAG: ABC transporter substrate-binding protein, partial [Chloroflexi bacterium]|nr:ABC transporter substrate-binding protein [Chloroflexota bacterium]